MHELVIKMNVTNMHGGRIKKKNGSSVNYFINSEGSPVSWGGGAVRLKLLQVGFQ